MAVLNAMRIFFPSIVGLVRLKTRHKWSHDTGSTLIHDVIVHLYCFDCSHCKYGDPASIVGV